MKKTFKKGFTLTELIVVMAVFSILMVGVMSVIEPVSNIFKRQSVAEKTYSYAHNIQTYLQTHLQYAESIVVATDDMFKDVSDDKDFLDHPGKDIEEAVKVYAEKHFAYNVIHAETGNDVRWMDGQIHVLRMVNSGDDRGQIKHSIYKFKSNTDENKGVQVDFDHPVQDEVNEINPAFFKASDAKYNFNYALGASTLVNVPVPAGGDPNSMYKALNSDYNIPVEDKADGKKENSALVEKDNFNISIVIDKAGKNNQGSIDVSEELLDDDKNPVKNADGIPVTRNYRAFRMPAVLQIAPIELTNTLSSDFGPNRLYKEKGTGDIAYHPNITLDQSVGWSFYAYTSKEVDFSNDIYFIYALPDEMTLGDEITT
ncbi:type II secretion system protein [Ruminococcus sp.]|uniref:type II secretion system protein n=1 Tax=Ruminococcus sp. TaxID=41978 RepID=UPI001B63C9D1|nr:type II secretion system protein [Ruminococcus sp.]MBP5431760.1 type II secretion system protein [Ruminococcus sp.]